MCDWNTMRVIGSLWNAAGWVSKDVSLLIVDDAVTANLLIGDGYLVNRVSLTDLNSSYQELRADYFANPRSVYTIHATATGYATKTLF